MKTGILFDLDGTLLNTLEDITRVVNHVMERMGYPCWTEQDILHFVGNGARHLMERAVPAGGDVEAALQEFRSYYSANSQGTARPYDGIPEALEQLAEKYPLAIVSNKPDGAVKPLCAGYFPGIYALGESAACPRKPAADMVFKAMAAIGVDRCVYVGDSEVDVATANNAGVPCVSVLWGFRTRQEIEAAGGLHFCEEPQQLFEKIEELIHGQ